MTVAEAKALGADLKRRKAFSDVRASRDLTADSLSPLRLFDVRPTRMLPKHADHHQHNPIQHVSTSRID